MDDFLPNKLNAKISNFSGGTLRSTRNSLQNYLFRSNEPGFSFEPWDITTLYQDRAGTTPVTAVGQSVGLRLSKDKGLALGPELATNGGFSSDTGWSKETGWSISGGLAVKTSGSAGSLYQSAAGMTQGRTYLITFTVSGYSAGTLTPFCRGTAGAGVSANGTYTQRIIAGSDSVYAINLYAGATFAGSIDNISVRELAGNHEVAINDAARTVYGREPKTGTRNRLTYTEQFDNAAWTKSNSAITPNASMSPDGVSTADLLYPLTTGSDRRVVSSAIVLTAVAYTVSAYIKAAGKSWAYMLVPQANTINDVVWFDIANGAVGIIGSSATAASIQNIGNGWYRCVVTGLADSASAYSINVADANGSTTATANGSDGIYIWGAQLELGASATAYQRVVSQYDITEAGVASCYYVQTDGVDDAYVTPTITPGTDKVQVFAGVRKNSDAAIGMVVEFSANVNSNNGTFWMAAPIGAGVANYDFASKGTIGRSKTRTGFAAPITNVLTGIGDISGDIANLRVNGNDAGATTIDQGTGNYLAYPAYIYGRGGTSLPFNGRDYGHAVRFGPNLDAATIARVEALIARNTPTVTL